MKMDWVGPELISRMMHHVPTVLQLIAKSQLKYIKEKELQHLNLQTSYFKL